MNQIIKYATQRYAQEAPYPVLEIFSYLRQSLYENVDESMAAQLLSAYRRGFDEIYSRSVPRIGLLDLEHAPTGNVEPDDALGQRAEQLGRQHGHWARLYRQALV
ncbi:hypothetical protein [Burkholderia seminalis]|uniref:hypothetical protein n=1 Tax=Burkholderia seminalis TaxID=488731 RepID=UPI001453F4FE|nr:hypothetical protein [Burkholderia seminalis]MCA8306870.1 hypothetical protein [Burkholderia seminalis]MCA8435478.1 hypothetical protein [Burkholderia seminalis]VWC42954.1 hypothetical protein BSE24067_07165 [Burkholderia seminalis]